MHSILFPHCVVMAFACMQKGKKFIVSVLSIAMFCCCYSGVAEEKLPGESIVKALSCFNNEIIYAGCDEAYRLNPSGNIEVPPEATGSFCSGPCLVETQQVLNCIDNMLTNFIFYNKATVQQMRYALNVGCSYARQRGSFNLEDYIGGETSNAPKLPSLIRSYQFSLVAAAVYLI